MIPMIFNTFNNVEHLPLRVFNRVVYMTNLLKDHGPEVSKKYFESFSEGDQRQLSFMAFFIKKNGLEKAKSFAVKDLEVKDEEASS